MEIIYLGTAAAEACPALFCRCEACVDARKKGGKYIRGRAGAVINKKILIDIPPDIYYSSMRAGISLPETEKVFFTHTHNDHCCLTELMQRGKNTCCKVPEGCNEIFDVYGSAPVHEKVAPAEKMPYIRFTEIKPYDKIDAGYGITMTALPAIHEGGALVYLISENGKNFFYGHDTYCPDDDVFDYLKDYHLDGVSLDCTSAMLPEAFNKNRHMNLTKNAQMRERLIENGSADENTLFIVSHFSHNGFISEGKYYDLEAFEKEAGKVGFKVAYDTMKIII